MISVIVADDHNLVRQGIRALLESADDINVVGEAEDGIQAIELATLLTPDVLVMDISMPRMNGTQATQRIRANHLSTQVVILSMYSEETIVRRALRQGAIGYVLKRAVTEELLLAIRAAARGDTYLSPPITRSILDEFLATPPGEDETDPLERLTPREREVLQLIAEGLTNSLIAQEFVISIKTVEKHRLNLMSKLNIHDLAGLVRISVKYGLVNAEM
jgi:DNA-binding NarL/FixJ family response regulator